MVFVSGFCCKLFYVNGFYVKGFTLNHSVSQYVGLIYGTRNCQAIIQPIESTKSIPIMQKQKCKFDSFLGSSYIWLIHTNNIKNL